MRRRTSEARRDIRAGHYERNLHTRAGEVRLKVPKLRQQTFETAIIERYRRRESSVEEALIEMSTSMIGSRSSHADGLAALAKEVLAQDPFSRAPTHCNVSGPGLREFASSDWR